MPSLQGESPESRAQGQQALSQVTQQVGGAAQNASQAVAGATKGLLGGFH
jgi:hypothetical protein